MNSIEYYKKASQIKEELGYDKLPLSQVECLFRKQNGKRLKRGETQSKNVFKESLKQVPKDSRPELLQNHLTKIGTKERNRVMDVFNNVEIDSKLEEKKDNKRKKLQQQKAKENEEKTQNNSEKTELDMILNSFQNQNQKKTTENSIHSSLNGSIRKLKKKQKERTKKKLNKKINEKEKQ